MNSNRSTNAIGLLFLTLLSLASVVFVSAAPVQLLPAADTLESKFPVKPAATSVNSARSSIKASVQLVSAGLLSEAAAAYRADNADFTISYIWEPNDADVKDDFFKDGGYDFAVTPFPPTPSDYQQLASLQFYPLHAIGVSAVFNLPQSVSNGATLALTANAMCRIFRGNITSWADPAIVATNPSMSFASIANKPIAVVTLSTRLSANMAFTTLCSKIDNGWTITPSPLPDFPTSSYGATKSFPDIDSMNSGVSDMAYSIGITPVSRAKVLNIPIANMVTEGGVLLSPTTTAVDLLLMEKATNGYVPGTTDFDLTNPTTPQAWPMAITSYLFIDATGAVSSCAMKKMVVQFFKWFYTSDVVAEIATTQSLVSFPSVLVDQLNILNRLSNEITCLDSTVVSAGDQNAFAIANTLVKRIMTTYSNFYLNVVPDRKYIWQSAPESLALTKLIAGEIDFTIANPKLLSDSDWSMMQSLSMYSLPVLVVGVVPIFTLPFEITNLNADPASVASLNLPTLYPLQADLDTLALLFIGAISSWLDPKLVALNPQLTDWFKVTGASTTITVIGGASDTDEMSDEAIVLFMALRASNAAQLPANVGYFPAAGYGTTTASGTTRNVSPFVKVAANRPNTTILANGESRLSYLSATIPGSISYRMLGVGATGAGSNGNTADNEFRILQTNSDGISEQVGATTNALKACSTRRIDVGTVSDLNKPLPIEMTQLLQQNVQQNWIRHASPDPGCWPISTLITAVLPTAFVSSSLSANSCTNGFQALQFLHYVQKSYGLTNPASAFGIIRISGTQLQQITESVIYGAVCDTDSLFVVLPYYYAMTSSVSAFGTAVSVIMLACCAIAAGVTIYNRRKVVIRSSSVPFLLVILVGMGFLFSSVIAWSATPSNQSCSAFLWLFNLGLSGVFIPLFAKTWRVWRIFSGAHLRVVKLSNEKLLMYSAAAIAADCLLLTLFQTLGPMQPIEYSRQLVGQWHYFTHCSVDTNGLPFVICEGIFKAGLLVFGAVMAFSTRNVKGTFNEADKIAWSIYNTLLSGIICVGIIVFVQAVETTLIVLVQICILWLTLAAFGFIFIPKFYMLMYSEQELVEASRSELQTEKSNGFSFASIAFLDKSMLLQYYAALQMQVHKVETRLYFTHTKFARSGTYIASTNGSVNGSTGANNNSTLSSPTSKGVTRLKKGEAGGSGGGNVSRCDDPESGVLDLPASSATTATTNTTLPGQVNQSLVPAGRLNSGKSSPNVGSIQSNRQSVNGAHMRIPAHRVNSANNSPLLRHNPAPRTPTGLHNRINSPSFATSTILSAVSARPVTPPTLKNPTLESAVTWLEHTATGNGVAPSPTEKDSAEGPASKYHAGTTRSNTGSERNSGELVNPLLADRAASEHFRIRALNDGGLEISTQSNSRVDAAHQEENEVNTPQNSPPADNPQSSEPPSKN